MGFVPCAESHLTFNCMLIIQRPSNKSNMKAPFLLPIMVFVQQLHYKVVMVAIMGSIGTDTPFCNAQEVGKAPW